MISKHWKQLKVRSVFLLSLVYFFGMNFDLKMLARDNISSLSKDFKDVVFISYHKQPQPPNHGTPKATRGTGSRGSCFSDGDSMPLTSLVGNNSLTKTLKEYPSIWIYIPFLVTEVPNAEFSLQDGENDLYRTTVQMPSDIPGIVQIELPKSVSPLKTDKTYRWYFEIKCPGLTDDSDDLSKSETLTGIVHKVMPSPELNYELETATTKIESTKILAKHGIWYDTLTQMAQLRLKNPLQDDYKKLWQELLSQPNVGLSDVSNKKIVGTAN